MSFLSGSILWNLLWIIPLILVLAIAGGVRRNKLLRRMFGTDERIARFSDASPGKRVFRIILLTFVVLLLAVAAARPSWGKQLMHDTTTGRDLLVLFDVSKSMLSDDVKPSRMDHAKWLVREIVKKNPGDRFGLIAFAGESFLVCPLTVDRASFIQLVDDLDTDTIPIGGTNVQLALEEAVKAFEGAQGMHKAVILVTDGDELTGRGASVVNDLAKAEIPVFAVGVGDPSNPAIIRVKDEDGKYRILTDREGNPVKSPLNEPQLTELARRTGGIYVRSTAAYSGIDELETRIKMLERKESEDAVSMFRPIERPAYPLTAAIILLALFFCISETHPRSVQTVLALAALLLFTAPNESRAQQAASEAAQIQPKQAQTAAPAAGETGTAEEPAREPVKSASELYNSGLEQQQVEHDNEKARTFYERAIAASEKEPLVRSSSYQNIGVIGHLDARSSMQGAMEKLRAQDLNAAEKTVDEAMTKLNRAEELYRESMRTAEGGASVIRNQQILLADRKQAEELKKQIEELKKLMEQARQQTRQAHDQQQQENQQQNQQDQQDRNQQNQQQDQQSAQDQQQQQSSEGQDQQNQQQQDRQSAQDQQQQSSEGQDQQNQQQQDQQSAQDQQQQSEGQDQQQNQQQSAQDKTRQAEETVSELEQKASEMNQDRQKQAAQQAREELRKAREEQQQGNGEKAEEHLKNALDTLNRNQQDQQGEQEKQDRNSGDQGEQDQQNDQGEQDQQEHPDAQPNQSDMQNGQQDMGDMEKQQAEAILDMMSKDELDYKDANRMQRPARLNNRVEKDW